MVAVAQSSTLPGRNETEPDRELSRPTRLGGSWSERSARCRVGTSPRTRAGMTSRAIRMRDLLNGHGRPGARRPKDKASPTGHQLAVPVGDGARLLDCQAHAAPVAQGDRAAAFQGTLADAGRRKAVTR